MLHYKASELCSVLFHNAGTAFLLNCLSLSMFSHASIVVYNTHMVDQKGIRDECKKYIC